MMMILFMTIRERSTNLMLTESANYLWLFFSGLDREVEPRTLNPKQYDLLTRLIQERSKEFNF